VLDDPIIAHPINLNQLYNQSTAKVAVAAVAVVVAAHAVEIARAAVAEAVVPTTGIPLLARRQFYQ
jgi:hypothetical protein